MTKATVGIDPVAQWAAGRLGVSAELLTQETIRRYQLSEIRKTVALARQKSSFYAARLAAFPPDWPSSLEDFCMTPLTSQTDVSASGPAFLCAPQSEISRIVTLETSGTTGERKRIFFTAADQQLALNFFAHGIRSMSSRGDRMMIALPCERAGSVGYQLALGISGAGVVPIPHGLIGNLSSTLARMDEEQATMLIGLPVQVLALAHDRSDVARRVFQRIHTIVLCSDHVSRSLAERVRIATGCAIFEHYGSTEMGLGGGLECRGHDGYHLREADLYFEIVSPETGESLPDGEVGEVVFTTLGRVGMPLIRYRTGDLSYILGDACPCGLPLRRAGRIRDRIDSAMSLGPAGSITISALDEALFAIPQLLDFSATLVQGRPTCLEICVYAPKAGKTFPAEVRHALAAVPSIAANSAIGALRLKVARRNDLCPVMGAKRRIRWTRTEADSAYSARNVERELSLS